MAVLLLLAGGVWGCRSNQGASSAAPREAARRHFERGAALASNGDSAAAVAEWRTSIALQPAHPAAYFAIADLYEADGQLREAIKTLDSLKRANPNEPHVPCKQAELLMKSGRWYRAELIARDALRLTPDCPLAHTVMASVHSAAGDSAKAVEHMKRAFDAAPENPGIALSFVQALCETKRLVEAARVMKELPENVRRSAQGRFVQGSLNRRSGRSEAETHLREALRLEPEHSRSLQEIGLLRFDQGKYAEARGYLKRGIEGMGSADVLAKLAMAERKLGLPSAAETEKRAKSLAAFEAIVRRSRADYLRDPSDSKACLNLAEVEGKLGNQSDALTLVSEILKRDPDDPNALDVFHRLASHQPRPEPGSVVQ